MDELYFSVKLGSGTTLCIAPLTDRRLALSGQDIPDPGGYFLYENSTEENSVERVEIIAQVFSEESALRLREMLNMA